MKIFLTGDLGVGKSTCINEVIQECMISVTGFQTLPFCENGVRLGFYMHALLPIEENDVRFSIQRKTCNETIPKIFDTFGVEVLKESQKQKHDFIILDEIGYLERDEKEYLAQLHKVIEECDNIVGVLRKCEIQYIVEIKERNDIILLDFDQLKYNDVHRLLKYYVEESI